MEHLRYFLAVARSGSISRASRQLLLDQPNLSKIISNLAVSYTHLDVYKRQVSTIVVSLILHNLWVCLLYGKAIAVILPASILKNFLKLPIDVMILYGLLKVVEQIKERAFPIPPSGGGGALDAGK